MESKYLISVIIPVHNTARYLERCVESVRNQTLKDIEIILVDNLSVDESPQICDNYSVIDERIKVLHLSVAGLSVARNAGIEVASAPYIGFVDSDDYIEPVMYEEMLHAMLNNTARMVYCNYCREYEDGRIEFVYPDEGKTYVRTSKDVQRDMIYEIVSSSACTKLFEKYLFDSCQFPVGAFFEDHATIYRWIGHYNKIVWIDKSYYHYLQHGDSICHTIDAMKRYHFFLAEYPRLEFIKTQTLFMNDELYDAMNLVVDNALRHFNYFLEGGGRQYPEFAKEMKAKIKKWLTLPKEELTPRNYKRIRKIIYFWWLYCRVHSSKRHG